MTSAAPDAVRRALLVAGTARYDHHSRLPRVRTDIDTVSNIFRSLGYDAGHRLLDETCEGFRAGLTDWVDAKDRAEDALVLYYSGHGDRDHERHYLLCRDSRSDRLAGTALATEDVVRIVSESGIQRLLLIIDTCYAGQGGVDAARSVARDLSTRLSTTRAADEHRLVAFSVIAAARSHELAEDGAFADALKTAISDPGLGGHRQPKLYLEQIVDRVNEVLAEHSPYQHATWGTLPSGEGFSFIPNPRYTPNMPDEGMDLAEQRTWVSPEGRRRREELLTHFGPRGRGVDVSTGNTGSYFTGRSAALTELIDWLGGRSQLLGRCAVVTGRGGVGKSSLLGRLVLLADPLLRMALPDFDHDIEPPQQRVHVAVHARHKLLEDVTAGIADAVGLAETDPERLIAALTVRTEPLVLVIDALDEAGTAAGDVEPYRIAAALLVPLSQLPRIRVLVGARPHMRNALGDEFVGLDLDEPRWTGEQDIEDFSCRLLLAPDGPGSISAYTEATAKPVAGAISARADRNYLVARLIARALASRKQPIDANVPGWEEELPGFRAVSDGSAGPAFRWALHEQLRDREARGRALLTALAHAEGSGLPAGDIWRATAAALTGDDVTGEDICWILQSASEHVVEGEGLSADGQPCSVYRLYHESYAQELRAAAGPVAAEHITAALLATVPVDPATQTYSWSDADPYVRAHLASHAAGGALLDDLVLDPSYLLVAETAALHRALVHVRGAEAQAARAAYERCAPTLMARNTAISPAAQLRLSAIQSGALTLAEAVRQRFPELPWDTLWAETPRRPYPFRAIGVFPAPLRGTKVLEVSEARVLATAHASGGLELWDFDTGVRLGQLPSASSQNILALAACEGELSPWLLVQSGQDNGWDSTVEVFDARTRHRLGMPVGTRAVRCALAKVEDTCVIGLMATDGTVQLIDAGTGSVLARLTSQMCTSGETYRERDTAVLFSGLRHPQQLAMGVADGRLVVAAAVGVERTAPRLAGRAELATWSVDPGQGWRVCDDHHYRLKGRNVAALAVHRGHILVSSEGRPRLTGRARAVIQRRRVTEWFYRRGIGPSALAMMETGSYRLWASSSFVRVTNAAGKETNWLHTDLSKSAQLTAIPSDLAHADVLTWRASGGSVQVRNIPLEVEIAPRERRSDALDAHYTDLVMGDISGRTVLMQCQFTKPPRLVDPTSGQVISTFDCGILEEMRLPDMSYCGKPGAPIIAYRWLRRWRAPHSVRVFEGASSHRVRLSGGFLKPITEMQVTLRDGRPLLAGLSPAGLTIWNTDGTHEGHLTVSSCRSLRTLAVAGKALLSVVDLEEQAIRIFDLPDFIEVAKAHIGSIQQKHINLAANPGDLSYAHDLAVWNGSPVMGMADQAGLVSVASILDASVEWEWKLPHAQSVTHLALTTVEERGAVVVCTSDGTVLLVEADSKRLLCQVHLGVAIRSITLISEGTVVLITECGLLCLRLAPAS